MAGGYLLVAAIDFGTAYSGYAYSFTHDYAACPTKVHTNVWRSGAITGVTNATNKAPTSILFNPQGEFDAFGYDAEEKYAELTLSGNHYEWFFFKNFKMELYNKKGLKRDLRLIDVQGGEMSATTVFSECIRFLREHLLSQLTQRGLEVAAEEVRWVLTVPAMWDDAAKQFMREAAQSAGIRKSQLLIALEPETASLYCKHEVRLRDDSQTDTDTFRTLQPGTQYLVLDAGGGTIDVTVHEVKEGGRLREVYCVSGGPWGGNLVDASYISFLKTTVGPQVWQAFTTEHGDDYVDLMRDFEVFKKGLRPESADKRVRLPQSLLEVYRRQTLDELEVAIHRSRFHDTVSLVRDKLVLKQGLIQELFSAAIEGTINVLRKIFGYQKITNTNLVLMVGAFSEAELLRSAIQRNFPNKTVISPNDPGLAVLKGAVMFGHDPTVISQRIARRTYGMRAFVDFEEGVDPEENRVVIDGVVKCRDFFKIHVKKDQAMNVGEVQGETTYTPVSDSQSAMDFEIYSSPFTDRKYISHTGCTYVGKLTVNLVGRGRDREIAVRMRFGETELQVEATELTTDTVTEANFDFLE